MKRIPKLICFGLAFAIGYLTDFNEFLNVTLVCGAVVSVLISCVLAVKVRSVSSYENYLAEKDPGVLSLAALAFESLLIFAITFFFFRDSYVYAALYLFGVLIFCGSFAYKTMKFK